MMNQCNVTLTQEWRSQNIPEPLCEFMEKWERKAEEAMKTYEFMWPAKLVETRFVYEGKTWSIFPETFGIPDDLCEIFQTNGMDDDLRAIPGVSDLRSYGFLD